jgi:hypothetical protein
MKTGLFIQSYQITTGLLGAPTFEVHVAVNTPKKVITGQGVVSNNSIHPPMEIYSNLSGEFSYMTVMPNKTHILVNLKGFGSPSTIMPLEIQNIKLTMVLESNWQSGTANYSYLDEQGEWVDIKDAKVVAVAVEELVHNR